MFKADDDRSISFIDIMHTSREKVVSTKMRLKFQR